MLGLELQTSYEPMKRTKALHVSNHENVLMVCDCARCEGKGRRYSYSTVKKHRFRYPKPPTLENNENRVVSRRTTPATMRSARGTPSTHVGRTPTPKPYDYHASPRLSNSRSLPRSPLSHIASNATNSPARSLRSGSAAPPPSPTPGSPVIKPMQGPPPPTPAVDMRRLLGVFMRSYPQSQLLGTPSTLAACSPGIQPLVTMDVARFAPHIVWDWDIHKTPSPRPRSPSLASIDSNAMPSEAGDDLKANDQDYWEGLLGEERPATPPRLFNDDDRLPALDRYNREFPEDFFDQDLPDNEDDPGEPENEPNDDALPAFQGFFRDLDAEEEDPPPNGHPCVAFDNEPKDFRNIMIRVYLLSAFSGVTNESIAEILTTHKMEFQTLEARGQLSEELRLRLPFFPETLRTLQNRLGMNINELFSIFAL
ncbi:hypothetical protein BDV93DRAFT_516133, partial [Ceratobasidium sp. AG-I]